MQTMQNLDTADIFPPYALQMWNPYYKYAAQPLNWEPSSMANGAIDGNVTQVRTTFQSSHALVQFATCIFHFFTYPVTKKREKMLGWGSCS